MLFIHTLLQELIAAETAIVAAFRSNTIR